MLRSTQPQMLTRSIIGGSVSVIIPTCESARNLGGCLRSLKHQSYAVDELIVVDAFSKDGTQTVASELGAKVILATGTQGAARNVGVADSKGEYILFLDSDQEAEDSVVNECISKCIRDGADAVKIPELFVGIDYWGRCSAFWKNSMVETWGPEGGIPRFYKRNVLLQSSGYNSSLRFWEDLELYHRVRLSGPWKEARCRGRVIHYEIASPRDLANKYLSYGRSIAAFRSTSAKRLRTSTLSLTLATSLHLLRNPGRSPLTFFGCLFQVLLKTFSGALGFLLELGGRKD